MIKRTITITTTVTAFLLMICIFAISEIYASQNLKLNMDSLDMETTNKYRVKVSLDSSCEEVIDKIEASEEGVVEVEKYTRSFYVEAIGKGDVVLTVTGDEGSAVKLPVHVGEKTIMRSLKAYSEADTVNYGDKKIYVRSLSGAKITVRIGKDKYNTMMPADDWEENSKGIKLKKLYDYKTKIYYTFEKDGVVYSRTGKVYSDTYLSYVSSSKKTLKVEVFGLHKGDVVKVRYAGKTYSKKIKKNYREKDKTVTFKVKKKVKKNAKLKISVRNKYKTRIMKMNIRLEKGKWVIRCW